MLTDKKALVTGGSRGIGKAIVKQLAENGCSDILLTDIAFSDGVNACASEIQKEISNSDTNIFAFKAMHLLRKLLIKWEGLISLSIMLVLLKIIYCYE
jgi:NAD(P)-dependent dehydrogenase (short-subunit alcohol dehydrogenase family)